MVKQSLGFLVCVLVIFALGLTMVFNTSAAEVLDRSLDKTPHYALVKQIGYALFGTLVGSITWFLGYKNILKLSGFFLSVGAILLVMVFIPGVGQALNGAHRWLFFFGASFQPSEFVKFLIPLYYIQVISNSEQPILLKNLLKLLGKIAVPIGLILIEPDNGTVALILCTLVVLFVLTRIRALFWSLPLFILVVTGTIIASQMPHVSDRIQIYLHPELDLQGKGHQPYQAKIAAGSGQLFGKGLGESLQKLDYLPEARSDYIAAIFAEEFGFIGIIGLIFLYMALGYFGFSLASQIEDRQGYFLISILTFLICFQAFLNLGVVSGLLPSKGTNLPFFSQGGSSLLSNFTMVALILNVARKTEKTVPV